MKKLRPIFNILFTVIGIIASVIVFAFFAFGKWLEYENKRVEKNLYR